MVAKIYDKILFVVAILLVAASVVLVSMLKQRFDPTLNAPLPAVSKAAYERVSKPAADVPTLTWMDPPPQSDGPDWVYEVFTSPKIYYLPGPPPSFIAHSPSPIIIPPQPPFGVVFSQIKPDPFRLQLVGIAGQDGIFTNAQVGNPMNGETFLARSGRELPDLHLVIVNFEVKPLPMLNLAEGSAPVNEFGGVAVVRDTDTKEETTLTTQTRLLNGNPFAVLKTTDGVELDAMKAGATFTLPNGRKYIIEEIVDGPTPSITVSKLADPDAVFDANNKVNAHVKLIPVPPRSMKGRRGGAASAPDAPVAAPSRHAPSTTP